MSRILDSIVEKTRYLERTIPGRIFQIHRSFSAQERSPACGVKQYQSDCARVYKWICISESSEELVRLICTNSFIYVNIWTRVQQDCMVYKWNIYMFQIWWTKMILPERVFPPLCLTMILTRQSFMLLLLDFIIRRVVRSNTLIHLLFQVTRAKGNNNSSIS